MKLNEIFCINMISTYRRKNRKELKEKILKSLKVCCKRSGECLNVNKKMAKITRLVTPENETAPQDLLYVMQGQPIGV